MRAPRTHLAMWPLCAAAWSGVALREGAQDHDWLLVVLAAIGIVWSLVSALILATGPQEEQ